MGWGEGGFQKSALRENRREFAQLELRKKENLVDELRVRQLIRDGNLFEACTVGIPLGNSADQCDPGSAIRASFYTVWWGRTSRQ